MARVRRLQHVSAQKEREMRIPRSRGAISGVLLVALGAWGAIVPFIGPSFNVTIGPDTTFDMTQGRLWLSLLPGVVAALGGPLLVAAPPGCGGRPRRPDSAVQRQPRDGDPRRADGARRGRLVHRRADAQPAVERPSGGARPGRLCRR